MDIADIKGLNNRSNKNYNLSLTLQETKVIEKDLLEIEGKILKIKEGRK